MKDRFFYSDSYALGYLLLSQCSAEPELITGVLKKHWQMDQGVYLRGLLDVGAADGRITELLSDGFVTIEAYEPNEVLFALLDGRLRGHGDRVAHNSCWQIGINPPNSISHVLMSHVLYHIPISRWPSLIEKLMGTQGANRRTISFVLWREYAETHRFCKKVNPERWHVTVDDLIECVEQLSLRIGGALKVQASDLSPVIRVPTRSAAEAVALFLLGKKHPDSQEGRMSRDGLIESLIGQGLDNSQTILTLSAEED